MHATLSSTMRATTSRLVFLWSGVAKFASCPMSPFSVGARGRRVEQLCDDVDDPFAGDLIAGHHIGLRSIAFRKDVRNADALEAFGRREIRFGHDFRQRAAET